jgi:hypothetical protein
MGVFRVSSCFMKSANPGRGLRADNADSSEGKVEVIGVLSCKLGLVEAILCPRQGNECLRDQRMTRSTRGLQAAMTVVREGGRERSR